MISARWQELRHLWYAALKRGSEQRSSGAAKGYARDDGLQRQAELIISQAKSGDCSLAAPYSNQTTVELRPEEQRIAAVPLLPAKIGHYRIVRVVGQGGMGVVYEAEQDQPRRRVALKVVRPGLASAEMLRRFDRESQALARLHHAGIAQIYEAGSNDTANGPQPYFAMEFIDGIPLRQYADRHRLSTRERLELTSEICEAVEHAHQNGIVHRDLKPGNILVEEGGCPKILDFGVARVIDSDAQLTKQTDVGQIIGTLAYMSPEQVLADPEQLDSRSDIYALGVILYELLTERLPYTITENIYEAVRTIREEDPKRLSSINRSFRGDVETIVTKALEKDKARRYATAATMSADIRRYLTNQPITARPASTAYQLRKFAQRHKALVSATAVVFAVLVAGVAVSVTEAIKARRAEQVSEAVNDFLRNDLLAQAGASTQSGPNTKPDPDLKIRTVLDRAAARLAAKFDRQPEVEAAIRDTIGQAYADLGLFPQARTQLERALELRRRTLGPQSPSTLASARSLGYVALAQGKHAEAESLLVNTVAVQRRILGPEHPETLKSLVTLESVYEQQGKYAQAEALGTKVTGIERRVWGPANPLTLKSMSNLALTYYDEGKYEQAEKLNSEVVETRRRVLGSEHPETLGSMSNLALIYEARGKYAEAEALHSQALGIRLRVLGPEHPDTLMTMNNLGVAFRYDGKFAQAEALDRQALQIRQRVLGPEHPSTLQSLHNTALDDYMDGRYAEAATLLTRTVDLRRRVLGPEHPRTLLSMDLLADVYAAQQRYGLAEQLLKQVLEISQRVLGPENPTTLGFLSESAFMYQREGKYDLAEPFAARVLATQRHSLGSESATTFSSALDLALAYISEKKFVEAEAPLREAVEFYRKQQPDNWERFRAESLLGASLAGQKKYLEAEPLLLAGYQGIAARKTRIDVPNHYQLDRAHEWLVQLYEAWGKPEKAAEWARK